MSPLSPTEIFVLLQKSYHERVEAALKIYSDASRSDSHKMVSYCDLCSLLDIGVPDFFDAFNRRLDDRWMTWPTE